MFKFDEKNKKTDAKCNLSKEFYSIVSCLNEKQSKLENERFYGTKRFISTKLNNSQIRQSFV